jgi:predicted permease
MRVLRRLIRVLRRREDEHLLDDEVGLHLDMETDDLVRQGMSRDEARRRALVSFGGVERIRSEARDIRRLPSLEAWLRDARYGVRALLTSPGFSVVVVLVLGVGAAAITSVFVLLNAIVLRPLAFPESDRLVVITHAAPGIERETVDLSFGLYAHYRSHVSTLESIGFYNERVAYVRLPDSGSERVTVLHAGMDLQRVLRVRPALGRLFTEEDGAPGFLNSRWTIPVLLAHDFWVDRFGADPNVVGRILMFGESSRRVVGVLPPEFRFPNQDMKIWQLYELPPKVIRGEAGRFAGDFDLNTVARMRPDVTATAVQAELVRILPRIEGVYGDATSERIAQIGLSPIVTPLKSAMVGDVAEVLWTLFGGMAFLLAIAVANSASLFLVRADHRRREVAVRRALGADRRQVARLFFLEAVMLTSSAVALGLGLSAGLLAGVRALAPMELPRASEIGFDAATVAFATGLAITMAILYGLLSVRRNDSLTEALRSGGAGAAVLGLRGRMRHSLTVIQVALALTLLVGSALMISTYQNLSRRELGFRPAQVLTVEVNLYSRQYMNHTRFFYDLIDRVRRLPGVDSAAAATFAPLAGSLDMYPVEAGTAFIPFKYFTPGYFQTIGTPVVDGQSFAPGEQVVAPFPVLVSAALARRLYPGQRAIGQTVRRLREDGSLITVSGPEPVPPFTIVGIVGDVRESSLREGPSEIVYIPVIEPRVELEIVPINMSLVVRSSVPPLTLVSAVRAAVDATSPYLSVGRVRTMDAIVHAARAREAFVGAVLVVAAAISLFLGAVGIYGSVANLVRLRTREIGIRLALGASAHEVVRSVAGGSLGAVVVGAALGIGLALAGTEALRSLLFGVEPADPMVFAIVTVLLVTAAAAAALLAARRAVRIAPVVALRQE